MITAQDIHNVTFEKALRGYRMDEVDEFLGKVAEQIDTLTKEKNDLEKKMYILAEKVDQYRKDEETLKTALLNAQRLGETVVYEAKQKAETILYDANSKASQAKEEAAEQVAVEERALAEMKRQVAQFKNDILNLYKQHIESLSAIPGAEDHPKKEPDPEPVAAVQPDEPVELDSFDLPAAPESIAEPEKAEPVKPEPQPIVDEPTKEMDPRSAKRKAMEANDDLFDQYQGIHFDD